MLWIAVLFRLLCPVSFSSAFSLLEVLRVPLAKSGQIDYIPENIGLMEHPEIILPVPVVRDAVNASLPSAVVESSVNPMQVLVLAGACLWMAGVVLMAGYSVGVYWKMKRKLGTAVWERENIYCISGFGTPFVCGIIFPRIYLPPAFGEGEAGGRIKNILRYKKPAKIMSADAVIIYAFVLAVLLANPETGGKQANMDSSGDKTLSGNEVSEVYYGIISNIGNCPRKQESF